MRWHACAAHRNCIAQVLPSLRIAPIAIKKGVFGLFFIMQKTEMLIQFVKIRLIIASKLLIFLGKYR